MKKDLLSKRRMRLSRNATASGQARGQIVDAISIRESPPEVEDRVTPGHWEGDPLSGAKNRYIATLVERHSRFAMLIVTFRAGTRAGALGAEIGRCLPGPGRKGLGQAGAGGEFL